MIALVVRFVNAAAFGRRYIPRLHPNAAAASGIPARGVLGASPHLRNGPLSNPMLVACVAGIAVLAPTPASAHHEMLLGPLAAAALTPQVYLAAQVFTRQTGSAEERTQETTAVVSSGFAPFSVPLSFSVVVPFSFIAQHGTRAGLEDTIVAARYRVDLDGLQRALSLNEGYVLGVVGAELPTNTVERRFLHGSAGLVGAGLMGVEAGSFSVLGYLFFRRLGTYEGVRESGTRFLGGSAAWTPVEDATGRLFSLQLGVSHEATFAERRQGLPIASSGGREVAVHPTVVWAPNGSLQLFVVTSLPISQRWHDPSERERFRLGVGAVATFGH